MKKMNVYFDFICIFCYRAYRIIDKIIANYPEIEIDWLACEINPYNGEEKPYQSYKILQVFEYLKTIYSKDEISDFMNKTWTAKFKEQKDINDEDIILSLVSENEKEEVKKILKENSFLENLRKNNELAYTKYEFEALPSMAYGEKVLKSEYSVGLNKKMLSDFFDKV